MTETSRPNLILDIVENNPGVKFRELMRSTGMKNGVLAYHVKRLEDSGSVKVKRSNRSCRFYPLAMSEKEATIIKYLRQPTARQIIVAILENHSMTFDQIAKVVPRSPSTISFTISNLIEDGVMRKNSFDFKKLISIVDKDMVADLLGRYHPTALDTASDNMSDTITSL